MKRSVHNACYAHANGVYSLFSSLHSFIAAKSLAFWRSLFTGGLLAAINLDRISQHTATTLGEYHEEVSGFCACDRGSPFCRSRSGRYHRLQFDAGAAVGLRHRKRVCAGQYGGPHHERRQRARIAPAPDGARSLPASDGSGVYSFALAPNTFQLSFDWGIFGPDLQSLKSLLTITNIGHRR